MSGRARKLVLWLAVAVALPALGLGLAGWFVIGTTAGARWALGLLEGRGLTVERVEGRLVGPLVLVGARYHGAAGDASVERVRVEWRPRELLHRRVHIERLDADGIRIHLAESDPSATEPDRRPPSVPIPVDLREGRIGDLVIVPHATGDTVRLAELRLRGSASADTLGLRTLTLRELHVRGHTFGGSASGRVITDAGGGVHVDVDARWTGRLAGGARLAGAGRATGDPRTGLRIEHRLVEPVEARVEGGLRWGADGRVRIDALTVHLPASGTRLHAEGAIESLRPTPRGRVHLRWRDLAWPPGPEAVPWSGEGELTASGAVTDFRATIDAAIAHPDVPPGRWRADVEGGYRDGTLRTRGRYAAELDGIPPIEGDGGVGYRPGEITLESLAMRLPSTGARLTADGTVHPGPPTRGRLRLDLRRVGWPPTPGPQLLVDHGRLTLEGNRDTFTLRGTLDAAGPRLPSGRWRLALDGRYDAGRVRAAVDLRARPDELPAVDARVRIATHADSARVAADLDVHGEGVPPARIRVVGRGTPTRFALDTIRGELSGGELAGAVVDGHATVAREPALRWTAALDARHPDRPAAGRLRASGVGASTLDVDTLVLRYGRTRIAAAGTIDDSVAVDLRAEVDALEELLPGAAGTARVLARARGTPADHRLEVTLDAERDSLTAALAGGYRAAAWEGVVERLALSSARAGDWRLRDPAVVRLARDSVRLGELCWSGTAPMCVRAEWDRTEGARWHAEGDALPLALLGPLLPPVIEPRGTFDLSTTGDAAPGTVPTGELSVASEDGSVRYHTASGRTVEIPYERFTAQARSDADSAAARLGLGLGDRGILDAAVTLHGTGALSERRLAGRLRGELSDRGLIARSRGEVDDGHARLTVDVVADGTVRAPTARGRIALDDVAAEITPLGVRIRDAHLAAESDDGRTWTLTGAARSGSGAVTVDGYAVAPRPDSAARLALTLRGADFDVYNTALAHVTVAPALEIAGSPERLDVGGDVRVQRARITARRRSTVLSPSPDVVIVGDGGDDAAAGSPASTAPARVYADVRVTLGDDVTIDAFGVRGRLAGAVTLGAEPERPLLATGEVRILDGSYTAYRQTLGIDRGRLLYVDRPLTDPVLDLHLTRRSGDVTVGMSVDGTADSPRITLTSEPPLSDDEVLAYLLVGRPLSRLNRSEGKIVHDAAQSVGIAGGNLVLERLRTVFGLGEARLERDGTGTSAGTSLRLGKQVLPGLHVEYGLGLIGTTSVLRIRYVIGRGFVLQTETGAETGGDLMYRFER